MTVLPRLCAPDLAVPHGFFTRAGGVSQGSYASLNGSVSGGDDAQAVGENRARVARNLHLAPAALVGVRQVHGARVITVTEPWPAGAEADAMVTDQPEIGLLIITADCAPVLFADPVAGVIGAAHAGWRGAVAGVLEATIAAMRALGARSIGACIGPCIAQASYQVGTDLRDAVLAARPGDAAWFAADRLAGKWRFDLPGYCAARLQAAGVEATTFGLDTYGDANRFFSHRRRTLGGGGPIGHQMSAIRR